MSFEDAQAKTVDELIKEGFGILSRIDVRETLKARINAEFRNYVILGACNPPYAYKALLAEDKIGTMLPCNVIVQELARGRVEVAAVEPMTGMQATGNPALESIAAEIQRKLHKVIDSL
jgi:uncharacterized protein (DUF302 family)